MVTVKIQYCVFLGTNVRFSSQLPRPHPARPVTLPLLPWLPLLGPYALTRSSPLFCTTSSSSSSLMRLHNISPPCFLRSDVSLSHGLPPHWTVSSGQIAVRLVLVTATENTSNCNYAGSSVVLSQKFNLEPLFFPSFYKLLNVKEAEWLPKTPPKPEVIWEENLSPCTA